MKNSEKLILFLSLKKDEEHRGTVEIVIKMFTESSFKINRHYEESFEMKFLDGSAFLNHHFVKLGWLSSWRDLLPGEDLKTVFSILEQNLNTHAAKAGGLTLTVPMTFIGGEKK